jgi:imidazolonepropionase-like amidohydrolase
MSCAEPRHDRRAVRAPVFGAVLLRVLAGVAGLACTMPAQDAPSTDGTRDVPPAAPCADVVAITHATVVDVETGALLPDRTVLIRAGRIEAVAPAAELSPPADADVLDATGRYLIPGLWDMHVHWYTPTELPLFLANGVTGVRQMFGSTIHHAWRKAQAAGDLLAPRQVIASRIVDGPRPIWPYSIAVGTAEEGTAAVRTALDEGADFIKVYSLLPPDAWRAVAEESRRLGVRFEGHVPASVSALEAADAGQATIEHCTGVLLAGSTEEEALREQALARDGRQDERALLAARTQDPDKARRLHEGFVANGTWMCPTLTVLHAMSSLDDEAFLADPRLRYMSAFVRGQWDPARDGRLAGRSAEGWAGALETYEAVRGSVRAMHAAGVRFLAGTDALNPYCFPGFSLHDELELLVGCGLLPLDALRAATWNPALYLGATDRAGSVAPGKAADLVLLEADPLQDIAHTRGIVAVVAGGRLLRRAELDALLAAVEAAQQPATR